MAAGARPAPGQFELLAADIGQGNAVLVRTARHTLLYDTGPRFSRESDAGHRVLVPLLRALGERIDMLMLSHRDSDHTGGAPAVLAMQPQAALLSSIEDGHELQALRPSTRCIAGQRWALGRRGFRGAAPGRPPTTTRPHKSNAMSCVLRISNGAPDGLAGRRHRSAAGSCGWSLPVRRSLKADVLLVPHHGSKTSSSAAFLDAVQPQLALVQAGYRNRFGHPAPAWWRATRARHPAGATRPQCGAAALAEHASGADRLPARAEPALLAPSAAPVKKRCA